MNDTSKQEPRLRTDTHRPMPTWGAPLIGLIIIALALVIGGLYLFNAAQNTTDTSVADIRINNEPETPRATADVQILETVSPSDDIDAIIADIESTKLDTIDTEMLIIEAEIAEFENKLLAP